MKKNKECLNFVLKMELAYMKALDTEFDISYI